MHFQNGLIFNWTNLFTKIWGDVDQTLTFNCYLCSLLFFNFACYSFKRERPQFSLAPPKLPSWCGNAVPHQTQTVNWMSKTPTMMMLIWKRSPIMGKLLHTHKRTKHTFKKYYTCANVFVCASSSKPEYTITIGGGLFFFAFKYSPSDRDGRCNNFAYSLCETGCPGR